MQWQTLGDLLRATAGPTARPRACLEGLRVHSGRMATNLAARPGTSSGHAGELVDRLLAQRPLAH